MAASRIIVTVAILAGLAVPATADAAQRSHRVPPRTASAPTKVPAPVKAAQVVARRYWQTVPCNGRVTVVAQRPLATGVDRTTDAWATFDSALGANNLLAPASTYRYCAISLARWRWPTTASMSQDWDMLCTTVIHETGHLLGHPHDLRHGSVMAPVFADASNVPSICRSTRPRAAR